MPNELVLITFKKEILTALIDHESNYVYRLDLSRETTHYLQKVLVFLSTHNKYLLFRDLIIGEGYFFQNPKSKVHVIILILKCK